MKEIIEIGKFAVKQYEEAFNSGREVEASIYREIFNDCIDQGEQLTYLIEKKIAKEK
jgi:hypothetical protein